MSIKANVRNFVINLNDSIRALAIGQTHTQNLKSIICHSYSRNHIAYSCIYNTRNGGSDFHMLIMYNGYGYY